MESLQTILVTGILVVWLCLSVNFLISSISSILYDRKRDKREQEQAARDLEYHEKRMESFKN